MPFTAAARAEIRSRDRTWLWKLSIRLLLAICDLVAIGIFAWSVSTRNSETAPSGYYYDSYNWGATFQIYTFIPLGVSFIWFVINTVYLAVKKRPIHPGWNVGADLLFVLGFVAITVFVFSGALSSYQDYRYIADEGGQACTNDVYSYGYFNCDKHQLTATELSQLQRSANAQLAGAVFLLVLIILHFVLFVWACVDTEAVRRNQSVRQLAQEMIEEMRQRGELPPVAQPLLSANDRTPNFDATSAPVTPGLQHSESRSLPVESERIV